MLGKILLMAALLTLVLAVAAPPAEAGVVSAVGNYCSGMPAGGVCQQTIRTICTSPAVWLCTT